MASRRADVAVIGAGPAGLAVAQQLLQEGHSVTVFESGPAVGGAWHFDSSTDSDLLGLDPQRTKVHSSMYESLRTNLPRALMTFIDFPFTPAAMAGRSTDPRMYPLHTEVLAYLEAFADSFGLRKHIKLNTTVVRVDPLVGHSAAAAGMTEEAAADEVPDMTSAAAAEISSKESSSCSLFSVAPGQTLKWKVVTNCCERCSSQSSSTPSAVQRAAHTGTSIALQEQQQQEWLVDAVAVCVGIFSEPNLPQVPGMLSWPGLQLHSHNYRNPEAFKGQKVMVVGASFSGEEIARAIASHAQQVYHCARTFTGPGTAREPPAAAAAAHTHNSSGSDSITSGAVRHPLLSPEQEKLQQQQQQQQPHDVSPGPAAAAAAAAAGVLPAPEPRSNIQRLPMLQQLLPDGSAVLQDGQGLQGLDAIVYCTGYKYTYPFLEHLALLETSDAHVRPLYQHMFVPAVGPSLAFIGLPWRCAKVPQFQLQGQLLARLLSGKVQLPSQQQMMQEQQQMFEVMAAHGIPRRYTHCMAKFMPQDEWAYAEGLCRLAAGASPYQQQQQQQQQEQPQHGAPCAVNGSSLECSCSRHDMQQDRACNCHLPTAAGSMQSRHLNSQLQHQQASSTVVTERQQQQQQEQQQQQQQEQQEQQQQQQQHGLLVMPWWLRALAAEVAGDILSRPDSFRDSWIDAVEQKMQQADREMLRLCQGLQLQQQ